MSDQIRSVLVWPGVLRIVHGCLALAVIVLLLTGWLLKSGLVLNDKLYALLLDQLHLPAGHLLALALVVRFYYLARDQGVSGLNALLPGPGTWEGIKEGLYFYTTFAKTRLPRYFAHHPVWAPVYLVLYLILTVLTVTGFALEFGALRGLFGVSSNSVLIWHQAPFAWLLMLVVLHVFSTVLHDIKGRGADVSAMLNGHRNFDVGGDGPVVQSKAVEFSPTVSIDSIGGLKPKGDKEKGGK